LHERRGDEVRAPGYISFLTGKNFPLRGIKNLGQRSVAAAVFL
jgi:hypothetical protein